ncbi:MAG TPA: DUF1877 family protein [Aggregicoccus sp.]|nr:DUF1877 family protein [Aggregicoccus sp.]
MSLGVHFALTPAQLQALRAAEGEEEVMQEVHALEQAWDETSLYETHKAWDPLHRVLSDGGVLELTVLGGRRLLPGGRGYTVMLVLPDEVRSVAAGLLPLSAEWFTARFQQLAAEGYAGAHDEDALRECWRHLCGLRDFYVRAAEQQRAVLFTVDA